MSKDNRVRVSVDRGRVTIRGVSDRDETVDARDDNHNAVRWVEPGATIICEWEGAEITVGKSND